MTEFKTLALIIVLVMLISAITTYAVIGEIMVSVCDG
jgi:hypothetical protein